jgi:hypothetical protein
MRETWLRPNRRAIWFGCAPPMVISALGTWVVFGIAEPGSALRWLGVVLMGAGIAIVAVLMRHLMRPRIAYRDGQVLFYLRSGAPFAVPVGAVEAFFIGQGTAALPGGWPTNQRTTTLVARLSQRDAEWARRDAKPALGKWCDGYVTIYGTWCEPINDDLPRRLNHRLKIVKSGQKAPPS